MLLYELQMRHFIFKRAKKTHNEADSEPKQPLSYNNLLTSNNKKFLLSFICNVFSLKSSRLNIRRKVTSSQNWSGSDPKEEDSKPGPCGHTDVYPGEPSALFLILKLDYEE